MCVICVKGEERLEKLKEIPRCFLSFREIAQKSLNIQEHSSVTRFLVTPLLLAPLLCLVTPPSWREALGSCSFFKEGKYFNQTHCLTKIKTLEFKEIKQIFLDSALLESF